MGYTPTKLKGNAPESFLPLTPPVLHILLALAGGEKHGYAIMQEAARTGRKVRLGPGTLYGAIHRLLEDGLVEESEERPDPNRQDTRRRYYHLTRLGRRVLAAETQRLAELVRLARSRNLVRDFKTA